jgi:uncharacterized protein (TIGR03437 family)
MCPPAAAHRLALALLLLITPITLKGQRTRIAIPIDSTRTIRLNGNLRPAALRRNDLGRMNRAETLPAMTLCLKPSPNQQTELREVLEDQQNPASQLFHRWLTPEAFADRFSLSQEDIAATLDWLRSQGFTPGNVARSRKWITFGGTAGQVEDAFQTEIHRYRLDGRNHFANAQEPSLPAALADVVSGIDGLDDLSPETIRPEITSPTGVHTLAPDDLATIYDITPIYQSGIDGAGETIAVMGSSAFNAAALADVAAFRSRFNLPPNVPRVVLNPDYPDPGVTASVNEAHLDIEWAGAVARNAKIVFVYSNTFAHAVLYTVDNNLAPIITMSANAGCEAANTPATMAFYQSVAQQANAQGITWVNSGSDAGPASCDANGAPLAESGLGLRFPASIPEVTAVGGTEFNEQGGTYWRTSNTASGASAISYIPEMVWNDTLALQALWAGGGGASIYFPKPAWQAGPGVPNDNARDLPDVAFASSFSHDGYYVLRSNAVVTSGGTSAAAPVFAGILALLHQYLVNAGIQSQPGLGNVNPALYRLAAAGAGVFHDITAGSNLVPCRTGTLDCPAGSMGFTAGPGYDLASGLGSVDVALLLNHWNSQPSTNSYVVISATPNPVYAQAPDSEGNRWITKIILTEEAGVGTTLTGFTIDGVASDVGASFGSTAILPRGSVTATVKFTNRNVPSVVVFGFTGVDASGQTWSGSISVPFDDPFATLLIHGIGNAASYEQVFAPGMLLYVAGSQLSPVAQTANSVPFPTFMGNVSATINGLAAPLFYVSPGQMNIQIPYETQPGNANLRVTSLGAISEFSFKVGAAAPGIFTAPNGSLVPAPSGSRGDTLPLFISGQGVVFPSIATGAAPAAGTPLSQLPAPTLPVAVTVGGIDAPRKFVGIPPGLVGVTQINFQIPPDVPPGPQPVVVTIGGVASAPATLTVTQQQ